MNSSFQDRQGSFFQVTFPDFPSFNLIPHHFRLHQEVGKQDVIDITYSQFTSFYYKSLKQGVPIKLNWTNGKVKNTFYGYIYSISYTTHQAMQRDTVIRAIGASLSLKDNKPKIWINKTAPEIVTDIAKRFKLKAIVTPNSARFSQQSIVGHTYWEKVQELATRIGYVAQVYGTELHFHPIDIMVDKFTTSIPVLSFTDPFSNPWESDVSQTLDMFKPQVSDYSDSSSHSKKEKTVSGIDPITGKSYSSTSSPSKVGKNLRTQVKAPLFKEQLPTHITGSKAMAKTVADGQARLSRFSVKATGAGQGDPRISPYRTVEINGTGDTTDGYWIITKCMHFLSVDGRYQVEFECMTDGTGKSKASPTRPAVASVVPIRNVMNELKSGVNIKPTKSSLSRPTIMSNETNTGFTITKTRWVGQ